MFHRKDDPKLFRILEDFQHKRLHNTRDIPESYRMIFRKYGLIVEKKELCTAVAYRLSIDNIRKRRLKNPVMYKNGSEQLPGDLEPNKRILFHGSRLPKKLQRLPLETNGKKLVWIWDRRLNFYYPAASSVRTRRVLQRIAFNKIGINEITPALKGDLVHSGALYSRGKMLTQRRLMKSEFGKCRAKMKKRGAFLFRNFFQGAYIHGMIPYYRSLVRAGHLSLGDSVVCGYWEVDDPVSRIFHLQSSRLMKQLLGRSCKPICSYLILYGPGGELEQHVDKDYLDYALSIQLDHHSNAPQYKGWPIYVQKSVRSSKFEPFYCRAGDALLLQGNKLKHYRRPLEKNDYSLNLVLLYGKS